MMNAEQLWLPALFVSLPALSVYLGPCLSLYRGAHEMLLWVPGVSFITVAYAQNGAESGVRDFPPQVCLITVTL